MTNDEVLQALDCEYPLPRAALIAATERRAVLAPLMIAEIGRCAANPSDPANRPNRLMFSFHLLAEWRETAAYRPLCALMHAPTEMLERVLGDALTETAPRVLASVFDGDPQPLYSLALDEKADEYARSAGFDAIAIVTALGALPVDEAENLLREAFDRLQPRDDNNVWFGWENAIAELGLKSLAPLVRQAHDADFLLSTGGDYAEFEEVLHKAIADNSADLKGASRHRRLWDDTIEEMEGWHGFTEKGERERLAQLEDEEADNLMNWSSDTTRGGTVTNPYRHVGRNDPCPCGSGLKFKHCHGKS